MICSRNRGYLYSLSIETYSSFELLHLDFSIFDSRELHFFILNLMIFLVTEADSLLSVSTPRLPM